MHLLRYVIRRFVFFIPVLIGVTIITFTITNLVPGDPALMMAGLRAKPEVVEKIREKLGLNKPVFIQYLLYVKQLLKGDLGTSLHSRRPVIKDLKEYFPATLELTLCSMTITLFIAIPFGVVSATMKDRWPDHLSRMFALSGVAMPSFWLGLMLLMVFYVFLGILPGGGRVSTNMSIPMKLTGMYTIDSLLTGNFSLFWDCLKHLMLPAITQAAYTIGLLTRIGRSSMLEVLRQDYVMTARAKGLSQYVVLYKHALKNAFIPVITMLGISFGYLLGGSVLIESTFSWPGMGRYAVRAITFLDFPAVMGVTVVIAFLFVLINLFVDFLYYLIDPRIRYN
jgi:peptide/nickel transport system permease protein